MNQLINKTQELSIKNQDDLSIDFHSYLNDIFKDSGFEVRTEGTLDIPYFNGKDICRVLGFKDNKKNIENTLKSVPDYYKRSLNDIIKNKVPNESLGTLNQNDLKSIYLTEGGMYYLIFHSRSEKAKTFEIFVNTILLPNIRKHGQRLLLDEIESKNMIIKKRECKIDKLIEYVKENNKIIKSLKSSNKDLSLQNQTILDLAKKQNIKLDNIDHFIKKELIPNRNLPPINENLQHKLILYCENNRYYFIRGQEKYINTKLKTLNNFEIIFERNVPNPIDFVNKLKEISDNLNQNLKKEIKTYLENKYGYINNEKYKKKFNRKSQFIIDNNEIILNNTNIKDIKKYIKDLITIQKYIEE